MSNGKSEYHHQILHIQISLGTKFQLQLIALNFWTKLTQNISVRTKNGKKLSPSN